jgi:hypothetical protein
LASQYFSLGLYDIFGQVPSQELVSEVIGVATSLVSKRSLNSSNQPPCSPYPKRQLYLQVSPSPLEHGLESCDDIPPSPMDYQCPSYHNNIPEPWPPRVFPAPEIYERCPSFNESSGTYDLQRLHSGGIWPKHGACTRNETASSLSCCPASASSYSQASSTSYFPHSASSCSPASASSCCPASASSCSPASPSSYSPASSSSCCPASASSYSPASAGTAEIIGSEWGKMSTKPLTWHPPLLLPEPDPQKTAEKSISVR